VDQLTTAELEAGLDDVRSCPTDVGRVELIVARPDVDQREVLDEGYLDAGVGLVGDSWSRRKSSSTPDGSPHPEAELTLINARFARLVAVDPDRAPLAGDQLHVDLDIGPANLPVGTRLRVGDAVIEITAKPHTGCDKFTARFGLDALRFTRSPVGTELRLRGVYARVVEPGAVRQGDDIKVERT
jgi:hypothetical protein